MIRSDVSFYLSMVEITANMCSRPLIMQIKNIKLRKFLEKFISFLESKNSGCAVCLVSITAQDRAIFCLSDHWEHGTYYWPERICKYPPMSVFQSYIIDHNIVWKSCLFFCHQEVQLVSVGSWSSLILWCQVLAKIWTICFYWIQRCTELK